MTREDGLCPCGSGETYGSCCGPLHSGRRPAPTALSLMRSRFSAFAVGDADYLMTSWHPSTRPKHLELDDTITWRRLQIVDTEAGGENDVTGVVEFRAVYHRRGHRGVLHERSRFVRSNRDAWLYLDGDVSD